VVVVEAGGLGDPAEPGGPETELDEPDGETELPRGDEFPCWLGSATPAAIPGVVAA
jgi:hypothetical protein